METPHHEIGQTAFTALLHEFRQHPVQEQSQEHRVLETVLEESTRQWDEHFPGFPASGQAHTSFKGVVRRGVRDAYLKILIQRTLTERDIDPGDRIIVNPVCVFGRHARDLAQALPGFQVWATDIFPGYNTIYRYMRRRRTPANYHFMKDNIFAPRLTVQPAAVVFFGACGSLSDAAIDYAIDRQARYVMCRTCCHDNIAGNTRIVKRPNTLNRAFRLKNLNYRLAQRVLTGHYFCPAYGPEHYPTSTYARRHSTSEEFLALSRHSVDSDLCRTLIDLDRYLRLTEAGYRVYYRGELLAAILA
jgi:hypothetical protein